MNLEQEVKKRGFKVAHIKTDSIKIPNATPDIIKFVMDYGKRYGYTFEHEATYERMCLVNDAVYIAKYASKEDCEKLYGYVPGDNKKHPGEWTATGKQFAVPYVFKTLFTHENIEFEDMCEVFSVKTALYLRPDGSDEVQFVGRVGQFCPVKGGRELLREGKGKDGEVKYSAVTGTKGYRWLESETVKELGKEADIDRSYYNDLVSKAVETIEQFGDFDVFVDPDSVPLLPSISIGAEDPNTTPCNNPLCKSCFECPDFSYSDQPFEPFCAKEWDVSEVVPF
jgi:hypothetical protein